MVSCEASLPGFVVSEGPSGRRVPLVSRMCPEWGHGRRAVATSKKKARRVSRVRKRTPPAPTLYLARWPDLTVALVHARDKAEALDILDELGDTDDCIVTPYRGPLFLELALPVDVQFRDGASATPGPDDLEVTGALRLVTGERMTASIPPTDTSEDMVEAIMAAAFPEIAAAIDEVEDEPDDARCDATLTAAVKESFAAPLRVRWRAAGAARRGGKKG